MSGWLGWAGQMMMRPLFGAALAGLTLVRVNHPPALGRARSGIARPAELVGPLRSDIVCS